MTRSPPVYINVAVSVMSNEMDRDVVVVGGGPAGLSAALVLGRACRRVLVLDAGRPANRVSPSISGLLGHERSPASLRRAGRRQLRKLPNVEIVDAEVLDVERDGGGVAVAVACPSGVTRVTARALLLANGLRYEPPSIRGIAALWGRSVFHCAFCDGWEVADRPIALHARGDGAARLALLTHAWSSDLVLCTDGPGGVTDEERDQLTAAGIHIREERIARLEARRCKLRQIVFESGPPEAREALFIRPQRSQPHALAERIGADLDDAGLIVTDEGGRTNVPAVYAAGDAAAALRSVAIAIGNGARVATAMAADLIVDRFAPPIVPAHL
jgi:thioredoxin reductase